MDLFNNPFQKLKATPRDNKRVIMQKSNELDLSLTGDELKQVSAYLMNPRKRLKAEIAWLPGIGPKRSSELLSQIKTSPSELLDMKKIVPIAWANIVATVLNYSPIYDSKIVYIWIMELVKTYEDIKPKDLCKLINEDRVVSGFPEVKNLLHVEEELSQQRQYYGQVIRKALNNLYAKDLVDTITIVVESETADGETHGPILVHDMVNIFEVEAQAFFDKEMINITEIVDEIKVAVEEDYSEVKLNEKINKLRSILYNWNYVARPIQVSAKTLGLKHKLSQNIAEIVRNLAIDLFNNHEKIDLAKKITEILQESFVELIEIAEMLQDDAIRLQEISDDIKINNFLEPIILLCKATIEFAEEIPSQGNKKAYEVLKEVSNLIDNLNSVNPPIEVLSQAKNWVAFSIMRCAIAYGNSTMKWVECKKLLDVAENYADDPDLLLNIKENNKIVIYNIINNVM